MASLCMDRVSPVMLRAPFPAYFVHPLHLDVGSQRDMSPGNIQPCFCLLTLPSNETLDHASRASTDAHPGSNAILLWRPPYLCRE